MCLQLPFSALYQCCEKAPETKFAPSLQRMHLHLCRALGQPVCTPLLLSGARGIRKAMVPAARKDAEQGLGCLGDSSVHPPHSFMILSIILLNLLACTESSCAHASTKSSGRTVPAQWAAMILTSSKAWEPLVAEAVWEQLQAQPEPSHILCFLCMFHGAENGFRALDTHH